MLDLPKHSVLVAGLDHWRGMGDEIIEPRLTEKLKFLLDVPALKLYVAAARPGRPNRAADRHQRLAVSGVVHRPGRGARRPGGHGALAHARASQGPGSRQIPRRRPQAAAGGFGAFRAGPAAAATSATSTGTASSTAAGASAGGSFGSTSGALAATSLRSGSVASARPSVPWAMPCFWPTRPWEPATVSRPWLGPTFQGAVRRAEPPVDPHGQ